MSARNTSRTAPAPKPFCKVCHDAGKSEKEYTSHFVKSEPGSNGKVVCPTLLAQECRYCFKHGHTAGYCPEVAAKKKAEEKALKLAARKEATEKPKPVEKKLANKFAAFDDSSDSESEVKVSKTKPVTKPVETKPVETKPVETKPVAKDETKFAVKKEDFPALPMKAKTAKVVTVMSGYAVAAAKTQEDYETERYEQQLIANTMKKNQMTPLSTQMKTGYANEYISKYEGDDESWEEEVEAVVRKPRVSASLLDWSALVDSDDEDW
jgi:hypothetical protein